MGKFDGCKIVRQNERFGEARAKLIYPDGKTEELRGTYALGVPISWWRPTYVADNGFQCGEYVEICGSRQ